MKYFLIIFTCVFFVSCFSQRDIINYSTIKLEGKRTNIRNLLDIDGYYPLPNSRDTTNSGDAPNIGCIMFFDDGSWVYFHFSSDASEEEKRKNMKKFIIKWKEKKQIRWGGNWGAYSLQNDTLIVHSYDDPALLKALSMTEFRYKIVDRETIQRIYRKVSPEKEDSYYKTHSPWENQMPMHLVPADSLPSSDCWLKEEKWIWSNESDWKAYMERIKQKSNK